MESVLSWNNKILKGSGSLALFFNRKFEDLDGKGQRAWSTREQEAYGLVSCLLKFKGWIEGRKVTIYTDHRSLESWYKENLVPSQGLWEGVAGGTNSNQAHGTTSHLDISLINSNISLPLLLQ